MVLCDFVVLSSVTRLLECILEQSIVELNTFLTILNTGDCRDGVERDYDMRTFIYNISCDTVQQARLKTWQTLMLCEMGATHGDSLVRYIRYLRDIPG